MTISDETPTRPGREVRRQRRIILLLDGTWNEDEIGENDTNIVRLRELIANSLDPLETASPSSGPVLQADLSARLQRGDGAGLTG